MRDTQIKITIGRQQAHTGPPLPPLPPHLHDRQLHDQHFGCLADEAAGTHVPPRPLQVQAAHVTPLLHASPRHGVGGGVARDLRVERRLVEGPVLAATRRLQRRAEEERMDACVCVCVLWSLHTPSNTPRQRAQMRSYLDHGRQVTLRDVHARQPHDDGLAALNPGAVLCVPRPKVQHP